MPPGLLIVAAMVVGPSPNGVTSVQVQFPLASAVVVQRTVPVGCAVTVTWLPGVPVPVKVGVVSLITLPAVGAVIEGETLLMLNARVAGGLELPAASLAVATTA